MRVTGSQRARLRRIDALESERDVYRAALEQIAALPCQRCVVDEDEAAEIVILHCFPDTGGPYEIARAALDGGREERYP